MEYALSKMHAEVAMKKLLVIVSAALLAGCAPFSQRLTYSGGDGSSCRQAVILSNAKCREAAVLGERMWLELKYPGHCRTGESVVRSADRQFDLVELRTAEGRALRVYFDSTAYARR